MSRRPQAPAVPVPVYEPTPQETALGQHLDMLGLADVRGAGTARLPAAAGYDGYAATSQLFRPGRAVRAVTVRHDRQARRQRPDTPGRAALRTNLGQ